MLGLKRQRFGQTWQRRYVEREIGLNFFGKETKVAKFFGKKEKTFKF